MRYSDKMEINYNNPTYGTRRMKKPVFISGPTILRYLISTDDKLDTLIMCKNDQYDLRAYDSEIYEALASIKKEDNFDMNKLKKFFEVVDVFSYKTKNSRDKPVLTDSKFEEVREKALNPETLNKGE